MDGRGFLIAGGGRLLFDPDAHRYTSDGVLVPSVSQVLRAVGMIDTTYYREEHSRRGELVHEILAARLRGPVPADMVPRPFHGYLEAIELFHRLHSPRPFLVETPVHLPKRAAGLVDFYGQINSQPLCVVLDWKTGPFRWWHEAQTAGYKQMLESDGRKVHRRGTVHLTDRGGMDIQWHVSAAGQQDWDSALYLVERRLHAHGRDERHFICGGSPRSAGDPEDIAPEGAIPHHGD